MKKQQQNQARRLFLDTELTREEIADIVGVNVKTITLWSEKLGWKEMKEATTVSRHNISRLANRIGDIWLQNLESLANEKVIPGSKDIDALNKLVSALDKINKGETIANYINCHTAFLNWLMLRDINLAKQVADQMQEFHRQKAKELS